MSPLAAPINADILANRPGNPAVEECFFATDTGVLYISNSTGGWTAIAPDALGVTNAMLAAGSVTQGKLDPATNNTLNAKRTARYTYDFAVLGGAVSSIPLTGAAIPANAVVMGGEIEIITTLASTGSATVGVQLEGAGDVLAASTAVASWAAGALAVLPLTAATRILTTVARTPNIVIAVAATSAGKANLFLDFWIRG